MPKPTRRPASRIRSVLLVEDTLEEALLIQTLLEPMGARVTVAQDGIRGCQLAENQEWDLVITDLNLPGRGGAEVMEVSKRAYPDRPILVITGYRGRLTPDVSGRADAVLPKPLERDMLLEAVEKAFAEGEARREGKPTSPERRVMAVGALPGDVELGCGGTLLVHAGRGHRLGILVMCAGGGQEEVEERRMETERGAGLLGAELALAEPFTSEIPSERDMRRWLTTAVEEFQPDTLFTPSPHDVRESRLRTHRAVNATPIPGLRKHYGYQAATTTLQFQPSVFVEIEEQIERKLRVLDAYRGTPDFRPHLQTNLAMAAAQYWSRYVGYRMAEPLEVIPPGSGGGAGGT